jgi:hypothetical protein
MPRGQEFPILEMPLLLGSDQRQSRSGDGGNFGQRGDRAVSWHPNPSGHA